jgi:hypothetical protein
MRVFSIIVSFIVIQCLIIITLSAIPNSSKISDNSLETSDIIFEEKYNDVLDFIVIGDWGFQGKGVGRKHGNQKNVAFVMKKWAERYNSQFIINVGGNHLSFFFYWAIRQHF